jgi:inositol phosphorylceramide glucuronosyltransferase 1
MTKVRRGVNLLNPIIGPQHLRAVVFLDADTIVLRNADVLFNCPGFCAVLRHSERLNSGVMVVTPSDSLFKDMSTKITELPSYTG